MNTRIFFTVLFVLLFGAIFAQHSSQAIWSKINESEIKVNGQRQIVPVKYLTYRVSLPELKELLLTSPDEKAVKINESNSIVTLPIPDGTFQKFRVVQSQIMAPELAASFPDIKTFSVKGIDDPYANGKLDFNEFGFHAMILSVNGDFFIDPYSNGNTADYTVYYSNDFIKDPAHRMLEESVVIEQSEKTQPPQKKNDGGAGPAGKSSAICVGANLRTYRLAVACTGEYAKAATGFTAPTVAQTLAKVVTTINRVDGVYETELSIRMELVPGSTLVLYTDPATDSFTGTANSNVNQLINLSQSVITASVGNLNFDIGHTFSTGGGGLANFASVCVSSHKAKGVTGSSQPFGDPYDIDYVAHEMGHQFGGNHTFNAITDNCNFNRNAATSVEPGSGITIMGYAGICGANNLNPNSIPYFHAISYDEIVNFTNSGIGSSCAVVSSSGNNPPVVIGSAAYIIPKSTPFFLSGSATDPDGDVLTYSWEETDAGTAGGNWNSGNKPFFRSYAPVSSPVRLFPRGSVVASNNYTATMGEYLPQTAQSLNFRLTARDNKMGGGGVCYSSTQITVDTSGPLTVTYPSAPNIGWAINTQKFVTWDPNFTDLPPVNCDSVRILLSYDSGNTYSLLVNSAPNNGFNTITVPNLTTTINTCRIKVESIGNIFYDVSNNDFTISTDPFVELTEFSTYNPLALSIWPNPAHGEISFLSANIDPRYTTIVSVLDILGNVIYKQSYTNKTLLREQIPVEHLSSGLYFIKVTNGSLISVQRFIKN